MWQEFPLAHRGPIPASDDPQRVVRQRPLQRQRLDGVRLNPTFELFCPIRSVQSRQEQLLAGSKLLRARST
jgi:hypothetical protein